MFTKDSPWTRVYLNRKMEAWYTSGQQSTNSKLLFDEEVIGAVDVKANGSGMVIGSGATNYDVLRLDGVCASVQLEAISVKRPPAPKDASVPWQRLERNVRDALGAHPTIAKADQLRRKECKGTTKLRELEPRVRQGGRQAVAGSRHDITRGGQTPMPAK